MRILLINYEFPPIGAGGGKASQRIAENLVEMGHTVRVVTARPTQVYTLLGNLLLLAGVIFWIYLAYIKITINKDISDHGFTLLGTLCLLTGFILRNTALTWELISPIRGLKALEFINGVEVRRVPVARRKQDYSSITEMATFLLSGLWYCLRSLRSFNPDIIHIFFAIPDGPIGWVLKRTHRRPYIISLRGADVPNDEAKRFATAYKVLRPATSALLKDADAVVAVSNGLRQHALDVAPDIKIDVVTNAIDLSQFTPPPPKPNHDPVRLLYVGRLVSSKNPIDLIKAVDLLTQLDDVRPFVLELVGDGSERAMLERLVMERNLTKQVEFFGWVERTRLAEYYRRADIFVTATIWEGMPNTVLEAMACGLPVVGSSAPGMDQLVHNGKNGYLVPLKDIAALASRLRLLINNPADLPRMGHHSRLIAEQEFTWEHITRQYVEIYKRVLAEKKA
jgi:glycosyltransferase involved in cell wall biosynthesis